MSLVMSMINTHGTIKLLKCFQINISSKLLAQKLNDVLQLTNI